MPVRWVDPANYHVTLKFLGEVLPEGLDVVRGSVERAASSNRVMDLSLEGWGAFPTLRRPRILWLGMDASPSLRCLKQDLEWVLSDEGFKRETRAFHPHITLGRCSSDAGAGAFRGLDEMVASLEYSSTVPVRTVDLMRSRITAAGPQYEVLSRSSLDPAP